MLRLDYDLASVAKALLYTSGFLPNDVSMPIRLTRFGRARNRLFAVVPRVSRGERSYAVTIKPRYERVCPGDFSSKTHRNSVSIIPILILSVLKGSSTQAVVARCFIENPPLGADAAPESRGIEDACIVPWGKGRVCQN